VHVTGRLSVDDRFGPRVVVAAVRAAQRGEYAPEELVDGPERSPSRWRPTCASSWPRSKTRICATCSASCSPRLAELERFREAPAAKHYHQAYRHGLLEHSLTVAQA